MIVLLLFAVAQSLPEDFTARIGTLAGAEQPVLAIDTRLSTAGRLQRAYPQAARQWVMDTIGPIRALKDQEIAARFTARAVALLARTDFDEAERLARAMPATATDFKGEAFSALARRSKEPYEMVRRGLDSGAHTIPAALDILREARARDGSFTRILCGQLLAKFPASRATAPDVFFLLDIALTMAPFDHDLTLQAVHAVMRAIDSTDFAGRSTVRYTRMFQIDGHNVSAIDSRETALLETASLLLDVDAKSFQRYQTQFQRWRSDWEDGDEEEVIHVVSPGGPRQRVDQSVVTEALPSDDEGEATAENAFAAAQRASDPARRIVILLELAGRSSLDPEQRAAAASRALAEADRLPRATWPRVHALGWLVDVLTATDNATGASAAAESLAADMARLCPDQPLRCITAYEHMAENLADNPTQFRDASLTARILLIRLDRYLKKNLTSQ